jgi:hypothetical protein
LISRSPAEGTLRVVAGEGTVRFDVPSSAAGRRRLRESLARLPSGSRVALADSGFGARRRSRRLAARAGVVVTREYLVAPSVAAPLYLVEDSPETFRYFWSRLLVFPFNSPALALAELARRAGCSTAMTRWPGWLAPGRLTVGRRA